MSANIVHSFDRKAFEIELNRARTEEVLALLPPLELGMAFVWKKKKAISFVFVVV